MILFCLFSVNFDCRDGVSLLVGSECVSVDRWFGCAAVRPSFPVGPSGGVSNHSIAADGIP